MITPKERDKELFQILERQPYMITLNGISLKVCKDVFPPELGYTSKHLAKVLLRYNPQKALDMGCGTGHLAFTLKRNGTKEVWAVDHHLPAVECTKENARINNLPRLTIVQSNLFENIPKIKFDLIVFNQPYYPAEGKVFFGCSHGGKDIIERFLKQAKEYLAIGGIILMPFSDMAGERNNPKTIAESFRYKVRNILEHEDSFGKHYVYEIYL